MPLVAGSGVAAAQPAGVFGSGLGAPLPDRLLGDDHAAHQHEPTYSSWINQVERWFAELTRQLLERGGHRSVQALERDIRAWVSAWNQDPKPFVWTKTAEQILRPSND